MADAGLPAPQAPSASTHFTSTTATSTTCTTASIYWSTCPCTIQHMPQLNRLHFKPEFTGKPEEDAEDHLLRTSDCIATHAFP